MVVIIIGLLMAKYKLEFYKADRVLHILGTNKAKQVAKWVKEVSKHLRAIL